jgi:putative restriction endonuclease
MNGYVAVTYPGWYERLSRDPGPRDANFWRPSARALRLDVGTPLLFKLKSPHSAIAGFGLFAGFSILPDWLAWETFDEANGVDSVAELRARLGRIQDRALIVADVGGRIGRCLIAEARFFPREGWVRPPVAWSPRTLTGAPLNLSQGDGARLWQACLASASALPAPSPLLVAEHAALRFGEPILVRPRLGQGIFRVQVLDAYGRACAVTQEHSLPVVEAAHIRPYSQGGLHEIRNGIALRSAIHRLFDMGYVTVDEKGSFVVGRRLKDDFENGRSYYALHGRTLSLPGDVALRPAVSELAWHREQVFRG